MTRIQRQQEVKSETKRRTNGTSECTTEDGTKEKLQADEMQTSREHVRLRSKYRNIRE